MCEINDQAKLILKCALSTIDDEHICEEPVSLSCGHLICAACSRNESDQTNIKCGVCNSMNSKKIEIQPQPCFEFILNQNMKSLFHDILTKLKNTFEACNEKIKNKYETIDFHIEFAKDEVDIRTEKLKNELDTLNEEMKSELEEIRVKWKLETRVEANYESDYEEEIRRNLSQLEADITKQQNLEKSNFYSLQTQMLYLKYILYKLNDNNSTVLFQDSEEKIEKKLIGHVAYLNNKEEVMRMRMIQEGTYDQIEINTKRGTDLCVLPNGNLLVANYNTSLLLYDKNYQLLKEVDTICGKQFSIVGIAISDSHYLYFTDYNNHKIIKTDLEFNKIAQVGSGQGSNACQFNKPAGLCFYNGSLFICDSANKRIQKFDSNLTYDKSYLVNFIPGYIKRLNNIACVRSHSEALICFYNLDNFMLVRKYAGHCGTIGTSKTMFYEYFSANRTFYFYNTKGELLDHIVTKGLGLDSTNNWNTICEFNGKLLITHQCSNKLIIL